MPQELAGSGFLEEGDAPGAKSKRINWKSSQEAGRCPDIPPTQQDSRSRFISSSLPSSLCPMIVQLLLLERQLGSLSHWSCAGQWRVGRGDCERVLSRAHSTVHFCLSLVWWWLWEATSPGACWSKKNERHGTEQSGSEHSAWIPGQSSQLTCSHRSRDSAYCCNMPPISCGDLFLNTVGWDHNRSMQTDMR